MMKKLALPLALLTGCGPIPVQVQSSKQEQTQRQSVKQEVANDLAADQQSSHASESKQGTNSMPVIIICNTVSSPNGHCIAPPEGSPLQQEINRKFKGAIK
jgi:phage gp45-like